jgi:hypothetical protein
MKATDPKVQFRRRFSNEDWQTLCRNTKFLDAIEAGEIDLAEVIAWEILLSDLNRDSDVAAKLHAERERLHEAVRAFVFIWADKTDRAGRKWKQSRQNHIRRLMKLGLQSEYAKKMLAQAAQAAYKA